MSKLCFSKHAFSEEPRLFLLMSNFGIHEDLIALILISKSIIPIPPSSVLLISVLRFILSLLFQRKENNILFRFLMRFNFHGIIDTIEDKKSKFFYKILLFRNS
jgi:hypothetical protein